MILRSMETAEALHLIESLSRFFRRIFGRLVHSHH
jgi:hypothetical protein